MPEVFLSPFGAVTVEGNRGRPSTRAEMDAARRGQLVAHAIMPPERADAVASAPPPAQGNSPMTNRLQTGIAAAAARQATAPTAAVRERGKALMRAEAERQGIGKHPTAATAASSTPASGKAMMADLVRSRGGTPNL